MITAYQRLHDGITHTVVAVGENLPADTLWLDLVSPSLDETNYVASVLGIVLPDHLKMREIETSSRLYTKGHATYLTIDVLAGAETARPVQDVMLMVLAPQCLVTVRFCEPHSLALFAGRIQAEPELFASQQDGLLALLDAITDRVADILEIQGRRLDDLSREIFHGDQPDMLPAADNNPAAPKERKLQSILQGVGQVGDLTHKIRGSINGMLRLATFVDAKIVPAMTPAQITVFRAFNRDLQSLAEHAQSVAHETAFMLDATLGQINIEQNNIIKIFSVVAVVFLPPTLFASIWGMNFHNIPELNWANGYYVALGVMVVSAILPLVYFKRRGWL